MIARSPFQLDLPIPLDKDSRRMEACRKLARMVRKARQSYAVQDFAKRRAAMLKYTRRGC